MSSGEVSTGQRRLVRSRATTFTARRIDSIVGRFYSVALILATLEVATNALEQHHYLNQVGFWLVFGAYVASNTSIFVSTWFFETNPRWYLINALVILCCVFAWPLIVPNPNSLPDDFTPFVWWMTGWGGISAGLSLNRYLAPIYLVVLAGSFAIVEASDLGGHATLSVTVQNAVYTVLISAVITGVVWFLRWQAARQDLAAELAATAAAEAAAQQAVADQRQRIAAVVHNEVLGALNAAIYATSKAEERQAAALAEAAITRLAGLELEETNRPLLITAEGLFNSIATLVQEKAPEISVSSRVDGALEIPIDVATALTEATQQAVTNSLMHAGNSAVKRRVSMKASSDSLKISIVDEGKGFWMNRVPKNRLGIQMIIFKRVRDVGAVAHLNSKPKEGTSVVLEWWPND